MGKRKAKSVKRKTKTVSNTSNEIISPTAGETPTVDFLDPRISNRCCVRGCRSNHDRGKQNVPVFEFPQEDGLLHVWLQSIPIGDAPSSQCVVCLKHFSSDMIETTNEVILADDESSSIDHKSVKLKPGAIPTLLPKRLSSEPLQVRKSKRNRTLHDKEYEFYMEGDQIKSFEDFQSFISQKITGLSAEEICLRNSPLTTFIMFLDSRSKTEVVKNILVHNDMTLEVFSENEVIPISEFEHILERGKIKLWSQMENIFSMVKGMSPKQANSSSAIGSPSRCIFENHSDDSENVLTETV